MLLDLDIGDDEVRARAFALVPQVQLQQAYEQSAALVQPDDFNSFAFLVKRYAYLRSFLGDVLEAVLFTGTNAARPTLEAIAFIRQLDATKPKWKKLPPETPCAFVPDSWVSVVCPAPTAINHQLWMLCLAEQLRNQLRSADILVPGSRQHQEWTSYLHSEAAWRERRASWFGIWYGPPDVHTYLMELEERFDTLMEQVTEGWEQNIFARIEDDKLVLSRDEKIDVPATARVLRQAVVELLPRMKLPDILLEVNSWLNYRRAFTHPNETQRQRRPSDERDAEQDAHLFAVILALGCNLPLTTMAEASNRSYHQLVHTSDWYLREATIREAIIALVDYHHSLPLSAAFGSGTSAMSDGIRFGVTARSLYARHNPRLPTRKRGVTVYDMTSDQGSQTYLDVYGVQAEVAAHEATGKLHIVFLPLSRAARGSQ